MITQKFSFQKVQALLNKLVYVRFAVAEHHLDQVCCVY